MTLVFAASDKGGTGRSVTSTNVAYRHCLLGHDVCYVDFDFGSPTSGAIFNISKASRGTMSGQGLHAYFAEQAAEPLRIDVWTESDRSSMRQRPPSAGRLVLLPGDQGGGEFPCEAEQVRRCVRLLRRLSGDFHLVLVDLSAGRSYATQMVLAALAAEPRLREAGYRWLVFHRWTRQHIIAAAGLAYGDNGILKTGVANGLPEAELRQAIRFVRTAVVHPESEDLVGLSGAQIAWLRACNTELHELAKESGVGRTMTVGEVPLEPMLQWREQIISDNDVLVRQVASAGTLAAFEALAKYLKKDSPA